MDILSKTHYTDSADGRSVQGTELIVSSEGQLRALLTDHFVDVFLAATISMLIFKGGLIREPRCVKYRTTTLDGHKVLQFGFDADDAGIQETMQMTNVFNGKLVGCIADIAEDPPGLRGTLWWVKADKLTEGETELAIDFMSNYLDFRMPDHAKKTT